MEDPIVEVAKVIRPFLDELVGSAEAPELDEHIADLLNSQLDAHGIEQLHVLLTSTEGTEEFTAEVLNDAPDFRPLRLLELVYRDPGSQPPPGTGQPVHAGKYVCPHGDTTWYRPSVGTPIPLCRTHKITLVRQS